MSCWLRQSTVVDVKIGPFVDSADGNTVESGLTITEADVRLAKNGSVWSNKSAAQTLTHEENGWYEVSLSSTDTNTLGILVVAIHESGALPVWREFLVVPANVYDSFFSTDLLQVDLLEWRGSTPNVLVGGRIDSSAGALANSVIASTAFASDAIGSSAVATTVAPKIRSLVTGTSDAGGTTTTMIDTGRAESVVDYWKGCYVLFTTGAIANQCRLITGFDPTTDTITFTPPTTAAVGVHSYEILPAAGGDLFLWQGAAPNALVSGRVDSSVGAMAANVLNAAAIAAGAIDDDAVAADMDAYHAKVWVVKESTTADHYAVVFFKNGQPVTTGITGQTIQVIKASDGTDLIASTGLTEVGGLGIYKKDESTNKMAGGAIYFAKVQATIDGSTRQWLQQIGRDSV